MTITKTDGFLVFEPQTTAELSDWAPVRHDELQFLKLSNGEYWIFYGATYLGAATRLAHENAWQAVSGSRGCCVAPLFSLVECAQRLMQNTPQSVEGKTRVGSAFEW